MSDPTLSQSDFGPHADHASARRVRRSFRYGVVGIALFALALWYAERYKRFDLLETQYRMTLTLEPQSARAVLRNVVRRDQERNTTPNPKYVAALAAVEESDVVLTRYAEAYALNPEDPSLAMKYGCRLFMQSQYKEARERFREASIHPPKNALPRYLEAAALAAQEEPGAPPEQRDDQWRNALALLSRANESGSPVIFPEPLWHASLPRNGFCYANLRINTVLQCAAPLHRFRESFSQWVREAIDRGGEPVWNPWLDTFERFGDQLCGSPWDTALPASVAQVTIGLQVRLDAVALRQYALESTEGRQDATLIEKHLMLAQGIRRLTEFEQLRQDRIAEEKAFLFRPFLLSAWAMLALGIPYAAAFLLNRLIRGDRRSWALPHARWAKIFAGFILLSMFLILSLFTPARDAGLGNSAGAYLCFPWYALLILTILVGLTYPIERAFRFHPGHGFTSDPSAASSLSLKQMKRLTAVSLMRRYFGVLLGGFIAVLCLWATTHWLLHGVYPWQMSLLVDGQQAAAQELFKENLASLGSGAGEQPMTPTGKPAPSEAVPTGREVARLIARCVAGDDMAQAVFVGEYGPVVRRAVMAKLAALQNLPPVRSEADDICNEVFENLLRDHCRRLESLRNADSIVYWLTSVAHNQVLTHVRRWNTQSRMKDALEREAFHPPVPRPDQTVMTQETCEMVRAQLSSLPTSERLALELYYLQGLKYSEIAEITGRSVGVVSSRIHRAKEKLRQILDTEFQRLVSPRTPCRVQEEEATYHANSNKPPSPGGENQ